MPMDKRPFGTPVEFIQSTRLVQHVTNTAAALYFLDHKWPGAKGEAYENARHVCKLVLAGNGTSQEARDAFSRALREAGFDVLR
jgi:hypothetical protein